MRSTQTTTMFLLLAAALVACGDGAPAGTTSASGGGGTPNGTGGAGGGAGGSDQGDVPISSPEAIFAYLKSGAYLTFPAESAVHPSTGPHGGSVRTYLTPSLKASLEAGNAQHPVHAAAVKELYQGGPDVAGWAVAVKTQAESDGGKGWYWYEIYSATDPSNPVAAGNGVPLCYNCHVSGNDFIRTPFPLD